MLFARFLVVLSSSRFCNWHEQVKANVYRTRSVRQSSGAGIRLCCTL